MPDTSDISAAGTGTVASPSAAASNGRNRTRASPTTTTRRGAMQVRPALNRSPNAIARAASSRSAPGRTSSASRPDNSIVAPTSLGANSAITARPVAAEPGQHDMVDAVRDVVPRGIGGVVEHG